ncbi:30S ribosomal protein S8 [Coprothermobacter platensis]|jgi:small subunit ribosomal protein S8|uniref:30S ribosomal protein S8 n=1 Tax=Coprothermobacter platensis TaxID=108819 RepID=UPI00035CD008|nr:30S ribosomal protein S8 [Coprothermobacter platensis]
MVQDTISDLLVRIKNASHARLDSVEGVPYGKYQEEILKVLVREGYIKGYEVVEKENRKYFSIQMKFGPGKQPVINEVRLISVPSRRIYARKGEIPKVMNGLGIAILTTSVGVLSDAEARQKGVGGQILCYVW